MLEQIDRAEFYGQSFEAESHLLTEIRRQLASVERISRFPLANSYSFAFDPAISQVFVTLFQEGRKPLRWGSRRASLEATLIRIINQLKSHSGFSDFSVANLDHCRILFEVVVAEEACVPYRTTILSFNSHRLEPGIHGLHFRYEGKNIYYMPTDAVVHGLMSMRQVYNHLAKRIGIAKMTDSITERAKIIRHLDIPFKRIRSLAFVSYREKLLPLYRGYPVPAKLTEDRLRQCCLRSIDWLLRNMYPDGRFLYYYDAVSDSVVDFQHPRMKNPLYNNILRHSGGIITLLRGYDLEPDDAYLAAARRAIGFLLSTFREHRVEGDEYACYPFFNKKSKLGGAGIGLAALMHYYHRTGDTNYNEQIEGLVRHLLSRICDDGEMIGYFIHPQFRAGGEILDPTPEEKKALFSFYYPGEALLGLALYFQHFREASDGLKDRVLQLSEKALDFLVDIRPERYADLFTSLPSDGWLMQAIEEWVKVAPLRKQSYIDFVFNDARAMIAHMYQEQDGHYFDAVGGFYYDYGEHVYPDASRCEGLIAAVYLADYLDQQETKQFLLDYTWKAAQNVLYTYNSDESCYAHRYPVKSIDSFRFKLTRQWVRVDSVQHAACFYSRLHQYLQTPG